MTAQLYRDLAWLPQKPPDFADRCKAVLDGPGLGLKLQALAHHALDGNDLARLAKTVARARNRRGFRWRR